MKVTIMTRNAPVTIDVTPRWTGTAVGYQLGYLSPAQKMACGVPPKGDYAVRIDGANAELVRVVNGYTSHVLGARI